MILKSDIITNLEIKSVKDLARLKPLMEEGVLKINKSQIARELDVDRRTVDKYINGYKKPKSRKCTNCITSYVDIIRELLDPTNPQVFYYKSILWRYLVDNHGYTGSYVNFCLYLKKYEEFDSSFKRDAHQTSIR